VQQAGEPKLAKHRSSRARLFPNGFTRLLRSSSDAKGSELPTHAEDGNDGGGNICEVLDTETAEQVIRNNDRFRSNVNT
jgi:hypothetical protein